MYIGIRTREVKDFRANGFSMYMPHARWQTIIIWLKPHQRRYLYHFYLLRVRAHSITPLSNGAISLLFFFLSLSLFLRELDSFLCLYIVFCGVGIAGHTFENRARCHRVFVISGFWIISDSRLSALNIFPFFFLSLFLFLSLHINDLYPRTYTHHNHYSNLLQTHKKIIFICIYVYEFHLYPESRLLSIILATS